jgi:hypothetical protein
MSAFFDLGKDGKIAGLGIQSAEQSPQAASLSMPVEGLGSPDRLSPFASPWNTRIRRTKSVARRSCIACTFEPFSAHIENSRRGCVTLRPSEPAGDA